MIISDSESEFACPLLKISFSAEPLGKAAGDLEGSDEVRLQSTR